MPFVIFVFEIFTLERWFFLILKRTIFTKTPSEFEYIDVRYHNEKNIKIKFPKLYFSIKKYYKQIDKMEKWNKHLTNFVLMSS